MKARINFKPTKEQQEEAKKALGALYLDFMKSEGVLTDDDIKRMLEHPEDPKISYVKGMLKDRKLQKRFLKYCKAKAKEAKENE